MSTGSRADAILELFGALDGLGDLVSAGGFDNSGRPAPFREYRLASNGSIRSSARSVDHYGLNAIYYAGKLRTSPSQEV